MAQCGMHGILCLSICVSVYFFTVSVSVLNVRRVGLGSAAAVFLWLFLRLAFIVVNIMILPDWFGFQDLARGLLVAGCWLLVSSHIFVAATPFYFNSFFFVVLCGRTCLNATLSGC